MKNWPDEEKAGRAKEEKIKKERRRRRKRRRWDRRDPHGEKKRIMKGGLVRKMTIVKNNLPGWSTNYMGGHGKMGKV